MRDESFNFLKELLAAPSPSGYEQPAQRVFRSYISPYSRVTQDVMGNVFGHIEGDGADLPKVMLVGHSDEIGFQVRYLDDKGFIYFGAIGGVDAHLTPGQRVHVHGRNGSVTGVVGKKPIHLMEPKDRETVVKLENQYIDIGASDKKEAEELVRVGDPDYLCRFSRDAAWGPGYLQGIRRQGGQFCRGRGVAAGCRSRRQASGQSLWRFVGAGRGRPARRHHQQLFRQPRYRYLR